MSKRRFSGIALARILGAGLSLAPVGLAQTEATGIQMLVDYSDNRILGQTGTCRNQDPLKPIGTGASFSHTFNCDYTFNATQVFFASVTGQVAMSRVAGTNVFNLTANVSWTNASGGAITSPATYSVSQVAGLPWCATNSATATSISVTCNAEVLQFSSESLFYIAAFKITSNRTHVVDVIIYGTPTLVPLKLTLGPPVTLRGSTLNTYRSTTTLSNPTTQDVRWSAVPLTESGGNWLSANPTAGTLRPGETTAITLTGDASVVPAGQTADKCPSSTGFPGRLVVTADGGAGTIPVNLIVNNVSPAKIVPGVEFRRTPGDWEELTSRVLLGPGDEISVDPDGFVTLRFPDGTTVDAKALSQFKIEAFCQAGGVIQTQILQRVGELVARVVSRTQPIRGDFVVRSPSSVASVRGTVFGMSYDASSGTSTIKVEEGIVDVTPANPALSPIVLQAAQQAQVSPTAVSAISTLGTPIGTPITTASAVNAASFAGPLVRGSLASLFGTNLAATSAEAGAVPLPTKLADTQLSVGNIPAPLIYVSPNQINFQVPFETAITGTVPIAVTSAGTTRASISALVAESAPGVFAYYRPSGYFDPIVVHAATQALVSAENPAVPGETLVVYATGVGNLTNPPATGAASPSLPLSQAVVPPRLTLGGAAVNVTFTGLTPQFVGLIQINIVLPATLPPGTRLPLVIAFGATESRPVMLSVLSGPPTPTLRLSTSSLDFGRVVTGQQKNLPVSIANTGTGPLTITSLSTTGAGFSITEPPVPFTVPPGQARVVTVRFATSAPGTFRGTLTISSSDPAPSAVVSLSAVF